MLVPVFNSVEDHIKQTYDMMLPASLETALLRQFINVKRSLESP